MRDERRGLTYQRTEVREAWNSGVVEESSPPLQRKGDKTGLVFGRLTVVERAGTHYDKGGKDRGPTWLCQCACGNAKVVRGTHLGQTKSCGCLAKEPRPKPEPVPCPVEGCEKEAYRKGWCYAHYMKVWRYGTPESPRPVRIRVEKVVPSKPVPGKPKVRLVEVQPETRLDDKTGQRYGSLTVVRHMGRGKWECRCDCGRTSYPTSGSLNNGSTQNCPDRSAHRRLEVCGYEAAHGRVYTDRGSAAAHRCVSCSGPAAQWAYDHADPDELQARGMPYSLDPGHYQPMCAGCHKVFDTAYLKSKVKV